MNQFNRRQFLQASTLGLASLLSPAVSSFGIQKWPKDFRLFSNAKFRHGVASGDPLSDAVIIWTRVTPQRNRWARFFRSRKKIFVGWEVATDPHFKDVIRRGHTRVTKRTDYTLKVDIKNLWPDQTFYYRFRTVDEWSPVGTMKTLPVGDVSRVKLAVMSCSNFPAGYFNAYTEASLIPDLDAVLHLGDYIYEHGEGEFATENADAIGRSFEPNNNREILNLTDYRRRYAQYRTDPGLQALHAAAPFICVWDDHEVANDAFVGGAENHNEGEGDFDTRKRQALRAYFEWLPIRPVIENNREIIYRQFEFGNLINLMMLDTRLIGREQQLDYANFTDSTTGAFNAPQFVAEVTDPNRTILGFEQRNWLLSTMTASNATWQVLGQQVLIGRMNIPAELLLNLANPAAGLDAFAELATIKQRILLGDPTVSEEDRARIDNELPYNLDAWDGYAAEREVIFETAASNNQNLVVLSGDTHNAWANNLKGLAGNNIGVEFATASVTTPGLETFLQLPREIWPQTEAGFQLLIHDLQYMNIGDRGYMTVTFTPDEAKAEWVFIDNIFSPEYNVQDDRAQAFKVTAGTNQLQTV